VTIIYGALVTIPVVVGLKFGVRISYVLYVFEAVLLIVLSVVFLAHGGPQGASLVPFKWPGTTKTTLLAFSLAILAFGGFEAAAPLAEETRDPKKNVPLAVMSTVIVSGIIYVLGSWALVTAFGPSHIGALAADPNPFHTAAAKYISVLAPLVTWILLTSVTSSYVAANTQTARVIFGGSRSGLWPRRLSRMSSRFHTPAIAAIIFVAPSILIAVVSTAFTNPITASGFLGTYGILGLIIMYIMANLALIVHWVRFDKAERSKRIFTRLVVPIFGMAILAIPVYGDLQPGQAAPYKYLPYLTVALILVGILYTMVLAARRPDIIRDAPGLLEGAEL
jgi:amino acid transporter